MNSTIEIIINLKNGDQNYLIIDRDGSLGDIVDSYVDSFDGNCYDKIEALWISEDNVVSSYIKDGSETIDLPEITFEEDELAAIRAAAQTTTQGVTKGSRPITDGDARR